MIRATEHSRYSKVAKVANIASFGTHPVGNLGAQIGNLGALFGNLENVLDKWPAGAPGAPPAS
jgi:hypothetical protein